MQCSDQFYSRQSADAIDDATRDACPAAPACMITPLRQRKQLCQRDACQARHAAAASGALQVCTHLSTEPLLQRATVLLTVLEPVYLSPIALSVCLSVGLCVFVC